MAVGRGVFWKKTLVSECKKLDMLCLSRKCDLDSRVVGSISWTNSRGKKSEIGVFSFTPGEIILSYTITKNHGNEKKAYNYRVYLDTTPCNYGGKRWWFKCPQCWRRCRILYLPPGHNYFLCRICHNLTYTSQQEGKNKWSPLFDSFSKIPELEKLLRRTRSHKKRQIIERKLYRHYLGMRGLVEWDRLWRMRRKK